MTRVTSVNWKLKKKKALKAVKGHRGRPGRCARLAVNRYHNSMLYAFKHRRMRKRDMRSLWIQRINAAARLIGLKYSELISKLRVAGLDINRKILANLSVQDFDCFEQLVKTI